MMSFHTPMVQSPPQSLCVHGVLGRCLNINYNAILQNSCVTFILQFFQGRKLIGEYEQLLTLAQKI